MIGPVNQIIAGYLRVDRDILLLIGAQACIQLMNASFFLLLNYFMVDKGYTDYQVADVLAYRFGAVFLLAFPLGLYIKGRRLKPFFYLAAIFVPLLSFVVIYAVDHQMDNLLYCSVAVWGLAYTCIQITALPFIIVNAPVESHSESISLSFLTFSATIFLSGALYFSLNSINPALFGEKTVLQLFAATSLLSIFLVSKISLKEKISAPVPLLSIYRDYDWGLILIVCIPTFIIAIGAGFTIPVINLFFLKIHGIPSNVFSIMGAITYLLVALGMLFMPFIRRRFGYGIAIILFQSLAVVCLFLLATTEYYKSWQYAGYIAIFFYVIRQPLMNVAGPMTSELGMYFVGKRNQELIAAINASIWSGSWFVSTKLFSLLRQHEMRYATIFLITVGLYIVGVLWYYFLIQAYKRKTGKTGREW